MTRSRSRSRTKSKATTSATKSAAAKKGKSKAPPKKPRTRSKAKQSNSEIDSTTTTPSSVSSSQTQSQLSRLTEHDIALTDDEREVLTNSFVSGAKTTKDLKGRLLKVQNILSKIDQIPEGSDVPWELSFPDAFIDRKLTKHSDQEVCLRTAMCLESIFRITAPTPPFTKTEIKKTFRFFTSQLAKLEDVDHPFFKEYYSLLERLAQVQTFVLLADPTLGADAIIEELFDNFFSAVSESHPAQVSHNMLEIMHSILESSDSVPADLLNLVLSHLLVKEKDDKAAYKLAQDLLRKSVESISGVLSNFLNESFMKLDFKSSKKKDKKHREKLLNMIFQVNNISTQLLLFLIPNLCKLLKDENIHIRTSVVQLMGNMFAAKESAFAADYQHILEEYLSRFHDQDARIRGYIADFARQMLLNHPSTHKMFDAPLRERILDPDEKVRRKVIDAICLAAMESTSLVSAEMMEAVGERTRDKKVGVSLYAATKLAQVYCQKSSLNFNSNAEWSNSERSKFAWIPNKIFVAWLMQQDSSSKIELERIIQDELIPSDNLEERTGCLIEAFSSLNQYGKEAFSRILRLKNAYYTELAGYFELRREIKNTNNSMDEEQQERIKSKFQEYFLKFVSQLPDPRNGLKIWKQLHGMKDGGVMRSLAKIINQDITSEERLRAQDDFEARIESSRQKEVEQYVDYLLPRLSMTLANNEIVELIFKEIDGYLEEEEPRLDQCTVALQFLLKIAEIFPSFLASSLNPIVSLLQSQHANDIVIPVLKIVKEAGKVMLERAPDVAESLKSTLKDRCQNGSEKEAKYAVQSITALFDDSESILQQICGYLSENTEYDETLISSLTAFRYIALLSPRSFELYSGIVDFLIDDLLLKDRRDYSEKWDEPSTECLIKMQAIKLLTAHIESVEDKEGASYEISRIIEILYRIIKQNGIITDDDEGEMTEKEIDHAHLRLQAVKSLLRLYRTQYFESRMTTEQFHTLAWTTLDKEPIIRQTIYMKIFNGLKRRLPMRFVSILLLGIADLQKENAVKAREYWQFFYKMQTNILQSLDVKVTLSNNAATRIYPEYILPHLVHLLAHHPKYLTEDPHYHSLQRIFFAYFDETMTQKTDNMSFFSQLLVKMKQMADAKDHDNTNNLRMLCDMGAMILTTVASGKAYSTLPFPGDLYLPGALYTSERVDPDQVPDTVKKLYLPQGFQVNDKARRAFSTAEGVATPKKAKAPGTPKDEPEKSKKRKRTSKGSSTSKKRKLNDGKAQRIRRSKRSRTRRQLSYAEGSSDEEDNVDITEVASQRSGDEQQESSGDEKETKPRKRRVSLRSKRRTAHNSSSSSSSSEDDDEQENVVEQTKEGTEDEDVELMSTGSDGKEENDSSDNDGDEPELSHTSRRTRRRF